MDGNKRSTKNYQPIIASPTNHLTLNLCNPLSASGGHEITIGNNIFHKYKYIVDIQVAEQRD